MSNPLIPKWTGPYGGVPPFDRVKVEHFKPAIEAGMAEHLGEIERIASDPAAPTRASAAVRRIGKSRLDIVLQRSSSRPRRLRASGVRARSWNG